jgi:teichuronic acid biosynthesis glycosyltransferase TuaC
MLRVLTFSTLFPDSSRPRFGPFVERQTLELAAHPDVEMRVMAPIGLAPWPIARLGGYSSLSPLPEREVWKGLDVLRPRFLHLPGIGGCLDPAMMTKGLLPRLRQLRDEFSFDVIDAQFFFPDGPAAVALGKALGVPVSVKARGSDIHYWGARPATGKQVLSAGKAADGMLAVSAALKADMVAMGMPGDRIQVHYTGVDLDLFQPVDRAKAKSALGITGPLIVSVGTLSNRKGQELLIEALPALPNAILALIGSGPDRNRYEIKAKELGVADRVRFTGSIGHEEIAHWLGAADTMALPSLSEGLANVWVEALACGTPIVITDVGGAREVVKTPDAGRVVAANSQAIAGAIREILEHPRDPLTVRKCAERFTWQANTAALYAHLKSLT